MASLVGRTVSHYRILELLGEGGMGVVYKAEDDLLKRTVALKFLPPAPQSDPDANERFTREAQAASALDHPNICTIHEIGRTDDGRPFICMAYYEGESLKDRVERGPLKIAEALDIAIQVARGLAAAHERGIIHRDIKPANVLITRDGTAKIVDFGLAKLSGRSVITREGVAVGTIYYMSPEQVQGQGVDGRTDIWSLGVMLHEMVTGRRPFDGEQQNAILYSILNTSPEPPTAVRTGVPMELERIIVKCMEKRPEDRYQHLDELLVDLRRIVRRTDQATRVSAGPVPAKRENGGRKKIRLIVVGLAVTVLAASGLYWLLRAPEQNAATSLKRKSIAVLPFTSITKDPADEQFADGIHDDILTQLTKIRDMRVIGRISMVQYRDTRKRLREIGDELDAGYILEGSVRRSQGKVRITAQLIDAETEGHLWANDYDRNLADILAVQAEIAMKIASSLKTVLSPAEKTSIATPITTNQQAYDYYLKGNYYWYHAATAEGNTLAAEYYRKATEADPNFAAAYARLSMVCSGLYYTKQDRSPARQRQSEKTLAEAARLKPDLPEVHHARGLYYAEIRNDPEAALEEYRLALEKQPGDAEVMFDLAYSFVRKRNMPEALQWLTRGVNLEPLAIFSGMHPEVINVVLRNWDEALRWANRYIASQPRDPYGYYEKVYILLDGFGDPDRARAVLEEEARYATSEIRGSSTSGWPGWRVEYFSRHFGRALGCLDSDTSEPYALQRGVALHFMGKKEEANKWFRKACSIAEGYLAREPSSGAAYKDLGMAYAWLGKKKEAVAAIKKSLELTPPESDQWLYRERREELLAAAYAVTGENNRAVDQMIYLLRKPSFLSAWKIRLDPIYDRIRNDPRIQSLMAETH